MHKTSVLLRQNLRTFAQRSPMFLNSRPPSCRRRFDILPPSHKKSFLKISYTSYTRDGKPQLNLVISGEGWGVGFRLGVGKSYTSRPFLPLFRPISESETYRKCAVPCQMLGGKCRENARKRYQNMQNPTPILHPTPYPTPNPSPEIASKNRKFGGLV